MTFPRLAILQTLFPDRVTAATVARRWRKAKADYPQLMADVIAMGGILTVQPAQRFEGAPPEPVMQDPARLAYEAGRRDLALQLLALMGTTIHDMNRLMEDEDA